MGFEEDWLLLLPCTFVHCRMMAMQPSSMLDRDWGGSKPTPRHKLSVTSVGVIFNQWGVKPPNPPTNRTLTYRRSEFCDTVDLNFAVSAKFATVRLHHAVWLLGS